MWHLLGNKCTQIHGEEITGKAERLLRLEHNLKITFIACKVSRYTLSYLRFESNSRQCLALGYCYQSEQAVR